MAIFVPTSTYISYGKISQYLAANDAAKSMLFKGKELSPNLSTLIQIVRKAIEWKNGIDSTAETINDTSLYLYDLCGKYLREAKRILNSGGSGEIINPSTGNLVTIATPFEQFRVGTPSALMTVGQTTLTLNYAGVVNPSIEITLDGVEVPYGDPLQFNFTATYNPTNVEIVFSNGVQNNWLLIIHMVQLVNL